MVDATQPLVMFLVLDGDKHQAVAYVALDPVGVRALIKTLNNWLNTHPERQFN